MSDSFPILYRNVRHLLSLHATVTPDQPFLISYDAEGTRAELTFAAFNGKVHQAAGFLYDDLGIRRGERVAVLLDNTSDTVILYSACWLIGAAVVPITWQIDMQAAAVLRASQAVVLFVHADGRRRGELIWRGDDTGLKGAAAVRQLVLLDGASDQYMVFKDEIANRPNTFISTPERPTLEDEALLMVEGDLRQGLTNVTLTQADVMERAFALAHAQMITGNQRLMCLLPLNSAAEIITMLITPLVVGGSVVLNHTYAPEHFWERIASEGVQIASVSGMTLATQYAFARSQAEQGKSIWGEGVAQWDLRRFRHVTFRHVTGQHPEHFDLIPMLSALFEEMFGKPVVQFQ